MCICDPNKRTPRCENCPITQTSEAPIDGFVVDAQKNVLRSGIPQSEARQMYIEGLLEKAQRINISREEALIILQGILADMLGESIPHIEKDANSGKDGPGKTNARLLVEIAKETRQEMLTIVDHSMEKRQFVRSVLHFPGEFIRGVRHGQ